MILTIPLKPTKIYTMQYITPLYVKLDWEEVESVKEMLTSWKAEHLTDSWSKEVYRKLKSPQTPSKVRMYVSIVKGAIKYCWPTVTLTILAGFLNLLQVGFISVPLLIVQCVLWIIFLFRCLSLLIIGSVVELENNEI